MKAVVQRVKSSSVSIDGTVHASIGRGFNVLFCAVSGDTSEDADYLIRKISKLRIFEDEEGKMNLSIKDVGGEMLVISQFTLAASTKKGNRPVFSEAMEPEAATRMYEYFMDGIRKEGISVKEGVFAADMLVDIENDGPVTIIYDTRNK